jgi:hypothetical protein
MIFVTDNKIVIKLKQNIQATLENILYLFFLFYIFDSTFRTV